MEDGQYVGLSQQIAKLEGRFEKSEETIREERDGASKYRSDMRIAMSAVSESQRAMTDDMRVIKELLNDYSQVRSNVVEMKPTVKELETLRIQGKALSAVSKFIWIGAVTVAVALAIVGGFVWAIFKEIAPHLAK